MDFSDLKTDELIELYKRTEDFMKFLEKEKQEVLKQEK